MNGLLRLHFPKGVNLEEVIQDEIIAAMCHHSWRDQENVWGSRLPMQLLDSVCGDHVVRPNLKPRARPTPTWTSMPERTLDFEF